MIKTHSMSDWKTKCKCVVFENIQEIFVWSFFLNQALSCCFFQKLKSLPGAVLFLHSIVQKYLQWCLSPHGFLSKLKIQLTKYTNVIKYIQYIKCMHWNESPYGTFFFTDFIVILWFFPVHVEWNDLSLNEVTDDLLGYIEQLLKLCWLNWHTIKEGESIFSVCPKLRIKLTMTQA